MSSDEDVVLSPEARKLQSRKKKLILISVLGGFVIVILIAIIIFLIVSTVDKNSDDNDDADNGNDDYPTHPENPTPTWPPWTPVDPSDDSDSSSSDNVLECPPVHCPPGCVFDSSSVSETLYDIPYYRNDTNTSDFPWHDYPPRFAARVETLLEYITATAWTQNMPLMVALTEGALVSSGVTVNATEEVCENPHHKYPICTFEQFYYSACDGMWETGKAQACHLTEPVTPGSPRAVQLMAMRCALECSNFVPTYWEEGDPFDDTGKTMIGGEDVWTLCGTPASTYIDGVGCLRGATTSMYDIRLLKNDTVLVRPTSTTFSSYDHFPPAFSNTDLQGTSYSSWSYMHGMLLDAKNNTLRVDGYSYLLLPLRPTKLFLRMVRSICVRADVQPYTEAFGTLRLCGWEQLPEITLDITNSSC